MIPRLARLSVSLLVLLRLAVAPCLLAQDEIPEISKDEATKHLIKKVEPISPPIAKLAKVGGPVAAEIVIASDGSIESVKVITGAPLLISAAVTAIKQWKFDPFVENGYPIRVRTSVEVVFPIGMSKDEQTARQAFFPAEDKCRQLVNEQDYSDGEEACSEAVELSSKLPSDAILERSTVQSLLGNALIFQGKTEESLPHYQEALKLNQNILQPNDAGLASNYANLGRAYFRLGDVEKGDQMYSKAVEILEATVLNRPLEKDNYTQRLKDTLLEYARFKRDAGQTDAADALEAKANRL
jgi:TonB family protein